MKALIFVTCTASLSPINVAQSLQRAVRWAIWLSSLMASTPLRTKSVFTQCYSGSRRNFPRRPSVERRKNDQNSLDYGLFAVIFLNVCLRYTLSGVLFEPIVSLPRFLSIYKHVIAFRVISSLLCLFRKPRLSFLPFPYLPIEPLWCYSLIVLRGCNLLLWRY